MSFLKTIPWREVCKFLSGAFFVSAGVLFYLYAVDVSVPIGGFVATPDLHRVRAVVHSILCAVTFYFGFIRK